MVIKHVLVWPIVGAIAPLLPICLLFGKELFRDLRQLNPAFCIFVLIPFSFFYLIYLLYWLYSIRYHLRLLQVEVNELGITFQPYNQYSISLFQGKKTFFWEDDIKISTFLPFSGIRFARKRTALPFPIFGILGFLNCGYIALIPTRDWIENIDEIDAFLETLPSNWLTELWRKPGTALEMEGE